MTCLLLKEPDKIGNILVSQMISYSIDLVGRCEQLSFGFQYDMIIDKLRTGLAQRRLRHGVKLVGGKVQHGSIVRYLLMT